MIGEKRARELFSKAVYKMQSLACISSTAPINQQIQLRAYYAIWELKQKHRGEGSASYMTKKAHKEALERIKVLEDSITEEAYIYEALEAVKEAGEYLSILADNMLRSTQKNRVF